MSNHRPDKDGSRRSYLLDYTVLYTYILIINAQYFSVLPSVLVVLELEPLSEKKRGFRGVDGLLFKCKGLRSDVGSISYLLYYSFPHEWPAR